MAEVFYPLLIDTGPSPTFDLSDSSNIVPDWVNGKIYSFGRIAPSSPITYKIWTHNSATGAFIAAKTVTTICGVSSNTFIVTPAICLGTDGNIYAMTSAGSTNADKKANVRLSKINTGTMTETAAVVPFAITNEIGQGYSITAAGAWLLVAFRLNGTDYLALMLNGSVPANIEIFNAATLASVTTFNFLTQSSGVNWLVVGDQPTATTQKLYVMQEDPNGANQQVGFVAVTFATTPSLSNALLANVLATSIDATWTGTDVNNVDTDPLDLMFNSKDNSLIFAVLNDVSSGPNLPPLTKLVKIDTSVGAVAWTVTVSNSIFALSNSQFAQASVLDDLSCCTLVFNDPNSTTYYTITPADGSATSATSTHFDGTIADNGVRFPAVWDSVRQRLIYYYEGSTNTSSSWPSGGWAVWGPDGDLGCCGAPPPPPPPSSAATTGAYFIERMDNRIWATVEDAWCLDAALSYPMPTPNATITASSGTGNQNIGVYNLINGGSGYTAPIGQICDIPGGGSGATVTLSVASGIITAAVPITIGSGYLHPTLSVLDTTGVGAVIQPIVTNYVTLSATTSVFTSSDVGSIVRVGGGKLEVVSYTSTTSVIANVISPITAITPDDPNSTVIATTVGNWTMTAPTSSVRGLSHLEGMTVSALADGGVVNDLTVVGGAVTLPYSASQILVGLPFTAQLQTMYMDAPGGPTVQSRRKSIPQVVLRVEDSRAPEAGVNQPDAAAQPNQANVPWLNMTPIKYRTPSMPAGQSAPSFSGDLDITNLFGGYDGRGQVAVQQRDPLPLTCTAIILWTTLGDSAGQ